VKSLTEWSCKMTTATLYTVSDYTVWLIIAVTVERYVVVCHALTARSVCRRSRAVTVIASLLATFIVLNLHFCWTVELSYVQVRQSSAIILANDSLAKTGNAVQHMTLCAGIFRNCLERFWPSVIFRPHRMCDRGVSMTDCFPVYQAPCKSS